MKKFFISILAILYFGLSTGATIHMHYCMGKLVGSTLWHNTSKTNDRCSNCGMFKEKKKCCKDEHRHLQIEKDQKLNDSLTQKISFPENQLLYSYYFEYKTLIKKSTSGANSFTNAPPENLQIPIYLRNRVFRI